MKKLLFLFFALSMMHVSGQNASSLSKSVISSSGSMIEGLASDQVKSLTKKLNLSKTQQEQVSRLIVSQLKSEKFQKIIGHVGANVMSSGDTNSKTEKIQNTLLLDKNFQKGMGTILNENQKKTMKSYMPK